MSCTAYFSPLQNEKSVYNRKMNNLKIALLQIMPGNNIEENRRIGEAACRKAKLLDADIALFPEMWSCGYSFPENAAELEELAVSADGEFVSFFGNLAAELEMAVGITFLEKHSPQPRNTLRLFDRHGKSVLTYAKVHTCDFGDERVLCAGDSYKRRKHLRRRLHRHGMHARNVRRTECDCKHDYERRKPD